MRPVLPLLLTLGVVAAGCSTAATTGPTTTDRLTIAIQEDRGPINLFAGVSEPLAELVYDKLVAPSPYVDEPQPWLATAVRAVDPSTWEVDLRADVAWHDGKPFGVQDVRVHLPVHEGRAHRALDTPRQRRPDDQLHGRHRRRHRALHLRVPVSGAG